MIMLIWCIFSWNIRAEIILIGIQNASYFDFFPKQVFQDKKHEDEVAIDLNSSLDLSAPQDLADAIQTRVCLEIAFIVKKKLTST